MRGRASSSNGLLLTNVAASSLRLGGLFFGLRGLLCCVTCERKKHVVEGRPPEPDIDDVNALLRESLEDLLEDVHAAGDGCRQLEGLFVDLHLADRELSEDR